MNQTVGEGAKSMADRHAQVLDRARRHHAAAEWLARQTIVEHSTDRTMTVTVNAQGQLVGVAIRDAAANGGMAALSTQLMTAVQRALSRIPKLFEQAMTGIVGTDDPTGRELLSAARKHFPAVPAAPLPELWQELRFGTDEEAPRTPAPRPRTTRRGGPIDDNEEFQGFGAH